MIAARISLFVSTLFFTLVNQANSQLGCGNPLVKLYDTLSTLGAAISYNTSNKLCSGFGEFTCCNSTYYEGLEKEYYLQKEGLLDYYNTTFVTAATEFTQQYELFLAWYSLIEAPLNKTDADNDVLFYKDILANLTLQKKECFDELWKHGLVMKCYVCSPYYSLYFKQLVNKTIEMYFNEEMCQTVQYYCSDYSKSYIQIAEKAKYLFLWLRKALLVPSYSTAEVTSIDEYNKYTAPMWNCKASGMCRGLCESFLDGKGISTNFTMPNVMYFQWFKDTFFTLKISKEVAAEQAASVSTKTRILEFSKIEPLQFTSVLHRDSPCLEDEGNGQRLLETAYQRLIRLSGAFETAPRYSNSYSLNTFNLSGLIANVSFEDVYREAFILQSFITAIAVGVLFN